MAAPTAGEMSISSAGYSAKNILHLLEEGLLGAVAVGVGGLRRQRFGEILEQALLFFRQLPRHRDARDDVQVPMPAPRYVRHALAAQLEARLGLRAGGDGDLIFAVDEGHAHLAAERERR